jgi:three-Cys-motif partner protein
MGRNLFRKPFDEGTIDKLEIFEDYFKEWLPVFLVRKKIIWKEVQIFDLFAGEGMDVKGIWGSPMRILKVLNENKKLIINSGVKIRVVVNEYERDKYSILEENLNKIADRSLYTLDLF